MSYQCPLCQLPLQQHERHFACENRHQFDMAKEGYVNLMPVQHKQSKDPGDNKEMMQARRTFLAHDFYAPMRNAVAQSLVQHHPLVSVQALDIGCGEGYYTHYFADFLNEHLGDDQHQPIDCYGLDISKVAVRYAAKRYSNVAFTVASSHRLPFADASLSAAIRIYAPCKPEELSRCLQQDGIVVTVTPGAHHLFELRERIYDEVHLHDEEVEVLPQFQLVAENKLNYVMKLTGDQAHDLLQMTPFAWKATDDVRAKIKAYEQFQCQADFMIRVFKRT
ncbi:23S rRNA (guanine(745)-N(1))-methyltransferase [Vibrio methylphosphonaticus]|uniref:23S rRNA (guanine(745)-N(1))-methyltransferase n=1 Tax=Vibrio methylphosphonaticus TaxID=2946866 RepID=UPI00202A1210|nr:23S rRNA (guanine(745)-N(1))-methyltransferase [Vibrio methylphosphonaticus]MCL9774292.1 23S rRNA (guanine(745)-N(1))-methyltransferase [Vibrio methylphosphonaticus]